MKLTKAQESVLKALRNGARLWRYSTQQAGWLLTEPHRKVYRKTIDALEENGWIEEDVKRSYYREGGGSDIEYKLVSNE